MDLKEIPESSKVLFLTVHSTVDTGGIGVVYLTNSISIGHGYEFILILYQTACISYLLYSFLRLENIYDYEQFNRIVIFWSFTLSFFIFGIALLGFEIAICRCSGAYSLMNFILSSIFSVNIESYEITKIDLETGTGTDRGKKDLL